MIKCVDELAPLLAVAVALAHSLCRCNGKKEAELDEDLMNGRS